MTAETSRLLAGLLALAQTGLAAAVVFACVSALRARRGAGNDGFERQAALPAALAGALVVVAALGWPAYVAHLAALVPLVDGAYCLAGVAGLGQGADGATGALPTLAAALAWTKPAAPALGLTAFLLARAQRRAMRWKLLPWTVAALLLAGSAGLLDGLLSGAYLVIPKSAPPPPAGCCSVAALPTQVTAVAPPVALVWLPFLLVVPGALWTALGTARPALHRPRLAVFAALSAAGVVSAVLALRAGATAALLGLPFHTCFACVLEQRPETALVPAGLAVGGAAFLAALGLSLASDSDERFDGAVRGALLLGTFGFLGAGAVFLGAWLTAPELAETLSGAAS